MQTGLSETPDDVAVAPKRRSWPAVAGALGQGLRLFGIALTDFARNNCHYVAAGIAYWTVLSLFPLALAAVSVLGYLYPDPADQQEIVHRIISLIPVSAEYLTELVNEVADARGTLGLLAVGGLLFTGTAMFSAVRKGINHAWHIGEPQYFVVERLIDFLMLLGVAVLAASTVVFATGMAGLASVLPAASMALTSKVW
jgi:membrane protein